ncbi:MAG: hypothetical protein LRZ85_05320 [Alphaproteobacteria bacterium]|nr:hypothetical protein [Alphaproteobacteria bacterium]
MAEGMRVEEAMKKLSPPIFFKQEAAFKNQISRLADGSSGACAVPPVGTGRSAKKTGIPAETLTAQAILGLSAARR